MLAFNPPKQTPRRYNNVMMDDERKEQVEVFLGLKARSHFPTLHLPYR